MAQAFPTGYCTHLVVSVLLCLCYLEYPHSWLVCICIYLMY